MTLFEGCVVMNKKIRDKILYILAWIIMVCAGILIQTGETDRLWQIIYRGVYDNTAGGNAGSVRSCVDTDVEDYVNYWESQVREVCDDGIRDAGKGGGSGALTENGADGENSSGAESAGETENTDTADDEAVKAAKNQARAERVRGSESTVPVMADISSSYIGMDPDTLLSYCYNATYPECVKSDELDAEDLLGKDMSLDMSTGGYKVLIYHTHSSEAYADSRSGEVDDTVVGLGQQLADILTDTYGIPVYHDTTPYDMMTGTLDRNASYDYSREGVSEILAEHPEIEVMIDLHRDGVPDFPDQMQAHATPYLSRSDFRDFAVHSRFPGSAAGGRLPLNPAHNNRFSRNCCQKEPDPTSAGEAAYSCHSHSYRTAH